MKENMIAVSATSLALDAKAAKLADQLHLHFISSTEAKNATTYLYLLLLTPDYLGLQKVTQRKTTPLYIDFLSGKLHYRSKQAGLRKEFLARAIGIHPHKNPLIVDATAGLGRDSFILATLGFRVIMLERSPILHALLNDALDRASQETSSAPTILRMQLFQTNAMDWLKSQSDSQKPDVIYLDPMFPERKKSASVKKEMVIMQDLLGKDTDAAQLLETALTCATKRVVVKRPRLAANLGDKTPHFTVMGKNNRFDVYLL